MAVAPPAMYGGVMLWLAVTSALGVCLPARANLSTSLTTDLLANFSAGVILSVALLHLLDDAQERLGKLSEYPAANAGALVGFLVMVATQAFIPCLFGQSTRTPLLPTSQFDGGSTLASFYALEASISLHSVLIGLGIGFAQSGWTELLVLAMAMSVHQFFEGFALGMLARRTQLSQTGRRLTCLIFTLSLPLGCASAVAAKAAARGFETSSSYLWVSGLLNAFAAGMLTQIGVEMVNHELTGSHAHSCADLAPLVREERPGAAESDRCSPGCALAPERPPSLAHRLLKVSAIAAGAALFGVLAIWA